MRKLLLPAILILPILMLTSCIVQSNNDTPQQTIEQFVADFDTLKAESGAIGGPHMKALFDNDWVGRRIMTELVRSKVADPAITDLQQTENTAKVFVDLTVYGPDRSEPQRKNITFFMSKKGRGWVIDDVKGFFSPASGKPQYNMSTEEGTGEK